MPTIIEYIGHAWCRPEERTVEFLIGLMKKEPLDPRFEKYGGFIIPDPAMQLFGQERNLRGWVQFWGNFSCYSCSFSIVTNDKEMIDRLTAAIRENIATPAYAEAKRQYERRRLQNRHRSGRTLQRMA